MQANLFQRTTKSPQREPNDKVPELHMIAQRAPMGTVTESGGKGQQQQKQTATPTRPSPERHEPTTPQTPSQEEQQQQQPAALPSFAAKEEVLAKDAEHKHVGLAAVVGAPLRAVMGADDMEKEEDEPKPLVQRDQQVIHEEKEMEAQRERERDFEREDEERQAEEEETRKLEEYNAAIAAAGSVAVPGDKVKPAFEKERADRVDVDAIFQTDQKITELKRRVVHEAHDLEDNREKYYAYQLKVNRAYWNALIDLSHSMEPRTAEALRYLRLKVRSLRNQAEELYSIDDALHGVRPGTARARTEGGSRRSGIPYRAQANLEPEEEGGPMPPQPPTKVQTTTEAPRPLTRSGDLSPEGVSLVDQVSEIDAHVARTADRLASFIEFELLTDVLQPMSNDVSRQLAEYETEGDAILAMMEAADEYAAEMYEHYQQTLKSNLELRESTQREDIWLADMNYRVAVLQQKEGWDSASRKIARLFEKVKELDMRRRHDTKDVLQRLIERQHELLDPCQPKYEQEALAALASINMDIDSLELDVRERARGAKTYRERPAEEDPTEAVEALDRMPEPMQSALIRHAEVLEHYKGSMTNKHWGTELAILTYDNNLMLWKAPRHVHSGATAAFAFKQITAERAVAAAQRKSNLPSGVAPVPKGPLMMPSHSLNMADSKASPLKDSNRRFKHAFEVVSLTDATGVSGIFKDKSAKKLILRAGTEAAMHEWVVKIRATEGTVVGDEDKLRETVM